MNDDTSKIERYIHAMGRELTTEFDVFSHFYIVSHIETIERIASDYR